MSKCVLRLIDQVNCKFENVDPATRRVLLEALKFMQPWARHTPLFKMKRWDGKQAFATVGGSTYINMLDQALPIIYNAGYEIEVIDERPNIVYDFPEIDEFIISHKTWPVGHPMAGEAIVLRDYQVNAIKTYFENQQSMQQIATAAGKTIISATISYLCEPHGRTVVIVPSKQLVEQTEDDFRNIGLDVGVFFGDRKEFGHTHTICTWQSLSMFDKRSRNEDPGISIHEFLEGVVAVQVDEAHSAKAAMLRDLLCGPMAHIALRWGMTGTVPKDQVEALTVLCTLGPVVGKIEAKTLQARGVMANCHVHVLQLNDNHVEFASYDEERSFLTKDPARLIWLADKCREIEATGNTLILVNNIETGKFLKRLIPNSVFVNGSVKTKDRKAEYTEVATSNDKTIIATYGVAAVGINVPRIFNLVLFEAGASAIRVIQSIGRALRMAADKDFANIYDICSSLKFSKKHLVKRKAMYDEAEYPHKTEKIKYK